MVLVAAVALGSSTYAWFVSNNTVTATTTKISAQSNSAYLVIDNKAAAKTSSTSTTSTTGSETSSVTALYPAQWANNFAADKTTTGTKVYQFETAYASSKDAATEKDGTRFAIGDPSVAVTQKYAYQNTFYIGTGGYDGIFDNLHVTGLEVNVGDKVGLKEAVRVLVKCGDNWEVWKPATAGISQVLGQDSYQLKSGESDVYELKSDTSQTISKDQFDQLPATTTQAVPGSAAAQVACSAASDFKLNDAEIKAAVDATVDVYIYYDGADAQVYTTNLENLKDVGVTVTFEATPTQYGGEAPNL